MEDPLKSLTLTSFAETECCNFVIEVTLFWEDADRLLRIRHILQNVDPAPAQILYPDKDAVRVFSTETVSTGVSGQNYGAWCGCRAKMTEDHEIPLLNTILHVCPSGVYWSTFTENDVEIETAFLEWKAMEYILAEPTTKYEVSVPDMNHPGEFVSELFETRAKAIEFARQWGADDEGMICLINELSS